MISGKMIIALLGGLLAHSCVEGAPTREAGPRAQLKATAEGGNLRGSAVEHDLGNTTVLNTLGGKAKGMPCQCELNPITWFPCKRVTPKCVFIDLGAANGNTLSDFVKGGYGPVQNCPSGQWEAWLVEANPRFNQPLKQAEATHYPSVHTYSSTAAYMCEAHTSFYLDTQSHENNYWGSSMSPNHADAQRSGHQKVTVPTINVIRLLYETTIPGDYVILKMDIEGAEWDVVPCLSKSNVVGLIDRLLVEVHPQEWGNAGTTNQGFHQALAELRAKGVDIPNDYHSQTL